MHSRERERKKDKRRCCIGKVNGMNERNISNLNALRKFVARNLAVAVAVKSIGQPLQLG